MSGRSVDRESVEKDAQDAQSRPAVKLDPSRQHASQESQFVDEDNIRIEVSENLMCWNVHLP